MNQLSMASDSTHENSLKALVIVLLMIFQIMSLTNTQLSTDSQSELTIDSSVQGSQSVSDLNLDFGKDIAGQYIDCLLYTSPSPRDRQKSRMPSSA